LSPGLVVFLVIVGIILAYTFISRLVYAIKEHKKIKQAQTLWSSKQYRTLCEQIGKEF